MKTKMFIELLIAIFLIGCQSKVTPPVAPQNSGINDKIHQAQAYTKAGNHQQAFTIYSELQDEVEDLKLYQTITLLRANSLYEMRNFPAALTALSPMPEEANNLFDCQKMVLAARILKQMNTDNNDIESLLEIAVEKNLKGNEAISFKAAALAELAKVYLENNKNQQAIKCFEKAAKLYTSIDNKRNADLCHDLANHLK